MREEFGPLRGPDHRWTIFGYEFQYSSFRQRSIRWGCVKDGRGTDLYSNPISAFLRLRKWLKE